jgi:hypothetical protein
MKMHVTAAEGVQSQLLQSVIGERLRRENERKQRLSEERRKEEGKGHDLILWEQERLLTGTDRDKMESMWEVSLTQYVFMNTAVNYTSVAEETGAFTIKKWTGYLLRIPFGINCLLKGSINYPVLILDLMC